MKVTVEQLVCHRCGYKWYPRIQPDGTIIMPRNCANKKCNSPYWSKPKISHVLEVLEDEIAKKSNANTMRIRRNQSPAKTKRDLQKATKELRLKKRSQENDKG